MQFLNNYLFLKQLRWMWHLPRAFLTCGRLTALASLVAELETMSGAAGFESCGFGLWSTQPVLLPAKKDVTM